MKLNHRWTNGLAWAGAVLVVSIPAADLISAQFSNQPEQVAVVGRIAPVPAPISDRPDEPEIAAAPAARPAPVEVAVATPAKPVVPTQKPASSGVAVDNFTASGKPLPSYITDAGASQPKQAAIAPAAPKAPVSPAVAAPSQPVVAATPAAPVATPVVVAPTVDPVEVASIGVARVAPTPMPLSMRPRPVVQAATPLIIDQPTVVMPPAAVTAYAPPAPVATEFGDWETGPLSDYLDRQQRGEPVADEYYDANGFYLDEAPNEYRDNPRRERRRDRVVAPVEDDFYYPFGY